MTALYVLLGAAFGFVLSRSGAADYNNIQAMFLFESVQLYGILGTAVVLTAVGFRIIKRRGRTVAGQPIAIELKPLHTGNVAGGFLFGIGWSIAGMCPGPILVNIGERQDLRSGGLGGRARGCGGFRPCSMSICSMPSAFRRLRSGPAKGSCL